MKTCIYALVLTAFAILISSTITNAADINVRQYKTGNHYILIDGPIVEGDLDRLEQAYYNSNIAFDADIQLHSPGGDGAEMKKIGNWLRTKRLRTVVASSSMCYSACAVIWASSPSRWARDGAKIGFHISSVAITPETVEWLNGYQDAFGWSGLQQFIQDNYAEDLRFYHSMNVADKDAFVANIAMASGGANFWMLTKANSHIVGNVNWY